MNKLQFPENFLWGTSTSGYQVEGNSENTDWWQWEQRGKTKDKSGSACDYWNKWQDDHKFLTELGCSAFRLGIEWARIEPQEGEFSREAVEHYRQILQDLKSRNLKTVVTLWHWVSPQWFQEKYGFDTDESVEVFARYAQKVLHELGREIDIVVTINEPMMPLTFGFLRGLYPPGKKNIFAYWRAEKNLATAHGKIYDFCKQKFPHIQVGVTLLYNFFEARHWWNPLDHLVVFFAKRFWNDSFAQKIVSKMDYLGFDYYFHNRLSIFGRSNENKKTVEAMGWEIYPEGIYHCLKELQQKYALPIYVMENGLPDGEDKYRAKYIEEILNYTHKAMDEGVEVRGYFHWSLMDNYEWLWGYEPKFGLLAVDYQTLERKPRSSFFAYAKICRENAVEFEID